jgi:hypothetical protein
MEGMSEGMSEGLVEGCVVETVGLVMGTNATGSPPPTQNVSNVPSCFGTLRTALDPGPENAPLHSVHESEPVNRLYELIGHDVHSEAPSLAL